MDEDLFVGQGVEGLISILSEQRKGDQAKAGLAPIGIGEVRFCLCCVQGTHLVVYVSEVCLFVLHQEQLRVVCWVHAVLILNSVLATETLGASGRVELFREAKVSVRVLVHNHRRIVKDRRWAHTIKVA